MSALLHRVLQNFAYQLKCITPDSTVNDNRFEEYEPPPVGECPESTAGVRKFFVEYNGEEQDGAATDLEARECQLSVRVHVEIPRRYQWREMGVLLSGIRHEINRRLRDQTYFVGYEDDSGVYASGATGIFNRWRMAGALDRTTNPAIWRYSTQWGVWLRESEQ